MSTSTLALPQTKVNLQDDVQATVGDAMGLQVRHSGRLIAAMDLSDAITVAKMILSYAEYAGIDLAMAAADQSYYDEDAWYDAQAAMREDYRAVCDDAMEHGC